jgi:Prolyl oligopeptidase, N-terminal beta-propeller domain
MISKRLARMAFMQGSGSNYRKLTTEEKKEAEKNFYETLNKTSSTIPKFRNLSMMFKDLIANATIPIPKKIPYQFEIKNDKYTDDYEWMSEEVNNQELTDYLADEFEYTDAVLGSKWLLSKDIFNEIIERTPEYKIQSVHKSGCK